MEFQQVQPRLLAGRAEKQQILCQILWIFCQIFQRISSCIFARAGIYYFKMMDFEIRRSAL